MTHSRLRYASACVISGALLLSACSPAHEKDSTATTTSAAAATTTAKDTTTATSTSTAAAGTVTLDTAMGKVDFPTNPKTVAAVGTQAVDDLLSLGITPAIIIVPKSETNIPWNADLVKDATVLVQANPKDYHFEDLAAKKPDLIVGDAWRINKDSYVKFSDIAPTLGAVGQDLSQRGWAAQVTALGTIFNKEDQAKQVIDNDKKLFAEARASMPGLAGKTGVICQYIGDAKAFGVIASPESPANKFITDLGMTVPAAIADSPDQQQGRMKLSVENIDKLSADFMAIYPFNATKQDLAALPGWSELTQVKKDSVVVGSDQLMMGLNLPSALSRAWVLKQVTPQLTNAAK